VVTGLCPVKAGQSPATTLGPEPALNNIVHAELRRVQGNAREHEVVEVRRNYFFVQCIS
jgi:hypothetical protein